MSDPSKATFSVRSAESPNGGANIPGASEDGRRIAAAARALSSSALCTDCRRRFPLDDLHYKPDDGYFCSRCTP